jgi:flagella basal body P-ring formation protein FlgA
MPADTWAELKTLDLWAAPEREGKSYILSQRRLGQMLRNRLPDASIALSLPERLTIRRGGAVITGQDLEKHVRAALAPALATLPGRVEIADLKFPEAMFLSRPYADVRVVPAGRVGAGRVTMRITVQDAGGRPLRQTVATAFVHQWCAVACAARPVNPGEILTPELIGFREKNLAFFRGEPWDGRGGPWRVKRPVGTGQPLTRAVIEPLPMVEQGAKVTLVYTGANVSLSIVAEALEDGGHGQTISVRNTASGRTVRAVVVDSGMVAVR